MVICRTLYRSISRLQRARTLAVRADGRVSVATKKENVDANGVIKITFANEKNSEIAGDSFAGSGKRPHPNSPGGRNDFFIPRNIRRERRARNEAALDYARQEKENSFRGDNNFTR